MVHFMRCVSSADTRRLCSKVLWGWTVYVGERRQKLALRHKAERVCAENTVRSVLVVQITTRSIGFSHHYQTHRILAAYVQKKNPT